MSNPKPKTKVPVNWTCSHCGHRHCWKWAVSEFNAGRTQMECDQCGKHTPGNLDKSGKFTPEAAKVLPQKQASGSQAQSLEVVQSWVNLAHRSNDKIVELQDALDDAGRVENELRERCHKAEELAGKLAAQIVTWRVASSQPGWVPLHLGNVIYHANGRDDVAFPEGTGLAEDLKL